jgi:hypothetical protein
MYAVVVFSTERIGNLYSLVHCFLFSKGNIYQLNNLKNEVIFECFKYNQFGFPIGQPPFSLTALNYLGMVTRF